MSHRPRPPRPEFAAVYDAVMATAGSAAPVAVPLGEEQRNTVQSRIRSYLADRGYRLHVSAEHDTLWCLAERVQ